MPRQRESGRSDPHRADTRGLGLGVELAGALIGFSLVGIWIDHSFGTSPWGTLVCVVLGFVGGFYNFIRSSLRILRSPVVYGSAHTSGDAGPKDSSPGDTEPKAHRRDATDDSD